MKLSKLKPIYDIIIVGAGVPGSSLAAALTSSSYFNPKKCLIIDSAPKLPQLQYFTKCKDLNRPSQPRVVTLTPSSLHFLSSLGLFQKGLINTSFVTPFKFMQVYDNHTSNHVRLQSSSQLLKYSNCIFTNAQKSIERKIFTSQQQVILQKMRESMGATIQNNHIQAALLEYIRQNETSILLNSKVKLNLQKVAKSKQFHFQQPYIHLNIANSQQSVDVKTRLVVASDGAKSSIRQQLNIPSTLFSYQQTGIVCTIQLEHDIETAFQRFIQGANPLALLPLWNGTASIVWSNNYSRNQQLLQLMEDQFVEELNAAFQAPSHSSDLGIGSFIGTNILQNRNDFERPPMIKRLLTKRFSFPLQNSQNQQYIKNRVAFIGDAAHSIHPLAGQGMNLGITDAALLANQIITSIEMGQDIGKKSILQNYQKQAKKNTQSMMAAINSVHQIYGRNDIISSVVKGIGNAVLHSSTFAKVNMMNFASGVFTHPLRYKWKED